MAAIEIVQLCLAGPDAVSSFEPPGVLVSLALLPQSELHSRSLRFQPRQLVQVRYRCWRRAAAAPSHTASVAERRILKLVLVTSRPTDRYIDSPQYSFHQ